MHKEMSLHLVEISWIPIFSPLQDGYFISSQETGESSYPSAVDNKKTNPAPLLCLCFRSKMAMLPWDTSGWSQGEGMQIIEFPHSEYHRTLFFSRTI